jgi:DNA-binding NtrC family response regulator
MEGAITRAVILCASDLIEAHDFDLSEAELSSLLPQPFEGFEMDKFLSEARETLIDRALAIAGGNQSQAARLLGTSAQNISKFVKTRSNGG